MVSLSEQVALVTGASRGVGRGVAVGLANAGLRVVATGRSIASTEFGSSVEKIPCDHTDDVAVARVFRHLQDTAGRLDILVNVAWGGYQRMVEDGKFTFAAPFWQQPAWRWDAMMTAGVRAAFVASQHAARSMVHAGRGLIVNISAWAAQKYIANTLYGISKAATDKMTADMAHELKAHGVTVVSLYPGLVQHRGGAGRRRVRLEQLRKPRVHRPRGRGTGERFRRLASHRIGLGCCGVGGRIWFHRHRWTSAPSTDARRRIT